MVSHPRMLTAIRTLKLACRTFSAIHQLKPPFGVLECLACREQVAGNLEPLHYAVYLIEQFNSLLVLCMSGVCSVFYKETGTTVIHLTRISDSVGLNFGWVAV